MERRQFLKTLGCASLGLLSQGCLGGRTHSKASQRPNILFIFTDDHAVQSIGAYGSRINRTPHIDRLAREGMTFDRCFCCNSICAPSRAAILTGKHSHANGQTINGIVFDGAQTTFPKLLQQAGYETALIGKWHLRSDPTGFDHWQVLQGQGHYYNPVLIDKDGKKQYTGYATDITTDLALDWLDKEHDPDKPFMLMCQHKAPHRTWAPGPDHLTLYDDVTIPEPPSLFDDYRDRNSQAKHSEMEIGRHMMMEYDLKVAGSTEKDVLGRAFKNPELNRMTPEQRATWDAAYEPKNQAFKEANLEGRDLVRWKYQRYIKDYLRCVASVDDNIGRVLDYLDQNNLADNTLVIYSSDQGFYLGEHGWYDKRWMYEESFRMPFIARWPGTITPGTRSRALAQNIDFGPTFLDAARVEVPAEMQGTSLAPLFITGMTAGWRQSLYYHYYEEGEHNVPRHYGVRTTTHKLIHYYDLDEWELFNLRKDPQEMHSVYDDPEYSQVRELLLAELRHLQEVYQVPPPS